MFTSAFYTVPDIWDTSTFQTVFLLKVVRDILDDKLIYKCHTLKLHHFVGRQHNNPRAPPPKMKIHFKIYIQYKIHFKEVLHSFTLGCF